MSGASEIRYEEQAATVPGPLDTAADTTVAMEGITERGPFVATLCTSFEEWKQIYGGYTLNNLDVVAAVKGYYDNGGTRLYFTRVVHFTTPGDPTTKTSAAGSLQLATATTAALSGYVESANAQPFDLEPNDTLICKIDGGGDKTATFLATAAARESTNSETFAITNGQTITVKIDRGAVQTIAFLTAEFVDITAATAEEVANVINAKIKGAHASATSVGAKVTITSDKRGTGSHVEVTGGTANTAIAFATAEVNGTGNVADIDAVTAAEVKAALDAVPVTGSTVTTPGGKVRVTSNTTGASSSVQVAAASTADDELGFDNASHPGGTGAAVNSLVVSGKTDGTYAHGVTVAPSASSAGDAARFNLTVLVNGVARERFTNVSMSSSDDRFVETIVNDVNNGSNLIHVEVDSALLPAFGVFGPLTSANDGLASLDDADYTGGESTNGSTGFSAFNAYDIDVLTIPGRATAAVQNAMVTYCEITRGGLVFPIFDSPAGYSAVQIAEYVETTAGLYRLTDHGAFYWPRVKVANPNKALYGSSDTVVVAPSGHIAGVYVRNDKRKIGGAFEQPAGIDKGIGVPRNVIGFETDEVLQKAKRDIVAARNINPISREKGTPIFIDGTATLDDQAIWPSIGQRRGVMFVEKTLIPGLAFTRHRNLRSSLYDRAKNAVEEFMIELTRAGAFKSDKPSEAFFVDFGPGLNNAITQRARTTYGRIGIATSEPNTFVVLYISPDTRALEAELAALAAA